jgi:hypothetical protein
MQQIFLLKRLMLIVRVRTLRRIVSPPVEGFDWVGDAILEEPWQDQDQAKTQVDNMPQYQTNDRSQPKEKG